MKYNNGEINISPKLVYFIEIPGCVGEEEKLELLKRDIMLIECNGNYETLQKLTKNHNKYSAYFYNLENMILKNRIKKDDFFSFAANIATFIRNHVPERSLVHTSIIDEDIANLFRYEGIAYVEKNMTDKNIILNTIINSIRPFFIENQRLLRSSLRLFLFQSKCKIEITKISDKIYTPIIGYVKDLSLTGIGFILENKYDLNILKLKDRLTLKLFLDRAIIKINMSIVTRIHEDKNEVGVSFNITDNHMIREEDANRLTLILYNWMKGIIDKNGLLESIN